MHGGHVGGILQDVIDGDEAGGWGTTTTGLGGGKLIARVGYLEYM